jgi:aspartyl-tRNA(Asn)/glutamyl-tRNA(Gln) amidotransferase subunit B
MANVCDQYEPVIGLEVHAQLSTRTKAFCACHNRFGDPPNAHVCPVCLGLPGALPTLNRVAVDMAVRAALALGCTVHERSVFARKHYFYPDLPKGYQITQYDRPLATAGALQVRAWDAAGQVTVDRAIHIERVHMEEDAGKNLHGSEDSVVDLNRAGAPLIEIVSAPDLRSGRESAAYLKQLRGVLMALDVCDGNMEQGSFRCDVNVSVRLRGDDTFGTRTEIKNVNSFRFVERAIDFEVTRQVRLLNEGQRVEQETRGWDERRGCTVAQRSKEEAHDYRYFPEPDLPPLVLESKWLEARREDVVELPSDKHERYVRELGLKPVAASVLTSHPSVSALFDDVVRIGSDPTRAANFLRTEVLRDIDLDGLHAHLPVSAEQVAGLLALVDGGTISGKQAKDVYALLKGTEKSAGAIVEERGMCRLVDEAAVRKACLDVLAAHPSEAKAYRSGKRGLLGFFVGEVMRTTGGSADPQLTNRLLRALLATPAP